MRSLRFARRSGATASGLPSPSTSPLVGHLGQWGVNPLGVLERGAVAAQAQGVSAFELRLWRRAFVGYSPEWNRGVLGDLETFRSRGSLSGLSPYLNSGIVQTDAPQHRPQRAVLNPGFTKSAMSDLKSGMQSAIARQLPTGDFDSIEWASTAVRAVLSKTFLGTDHIDPVLDRWLGPMEEPLPIPFVPRPIRFRAMNARLEAALADPPPGSLASTFAGHGGLPEMRVALAAGYDTTAHTLAWLLAHAAQDPSLLDPARHDSAIKETLRLYPAGWTGSRRANQDVRVDGVDIPKDALVLYSPYLTHRDPELWSRATEFRPQRFAEEPVPPWGYLPFAAGERTCLGRHYAHLLMATALQALAGQTLRFVDGDLSPQAGVTLRPVGPLRLHLRPSRPHFSAPRHDAATRSVRLRATPKGAS